MVTLHMASPELRIEPVYDGRMLTGIAADPLSLNAMENVLFGVQSIAEGKDPSRVLDNGDALGSVAVLDLRGSLWDSVRDAEEQDSHLGFLDIVPATETSDYLTLLRASNRNKRVCKQAMDRQVAHWRPSDPPPPSSLTLEGVPKIRLIRRRTIQRTLAQHAQAQGTWLEEQMAYEQKMLERELQMSRGFEAASVIQGIVQAAHSLEG